MNVQSKLKQKAVYWGPATPGGYGTDVFPAPVEMTVRWDDDMQDFINDIGEVKKSSAVILTATAVELKSLFRLGTLASIPPAELDDPTHASGVVRVRQIKKYANKKGTVIMWAVYI